MKFIVFLTKENFFSYVIKKVSFIYKQLINFFL